MKRDLLVATLRKADAFVTGQSRTVPCTPRENEAYLKEMQKVVVQLLSEAEDYEVRDTDFSLALREDLVPDTKGGLHRKVTVRLFPASRRLAVEDGDVVINYVEWIVGECLRQKRVKTPIGYPGGMAAKSKVVRNEDVRVDGLTPTECYNRYVLMQRDQSMVNALTPTQLAVAKQVWAGFLKNKVTASENARCEADRLQVVVDFEED